MRPARFQEEDSSEDSFLDVVANVVGVLIILVMLVGAQASRSVLMVELSEPTIREPNPPSLQIAGRSAETLKSELEAATQATLASQRKIQTTSNRISKISLETQAFDQKRVELTMHQSMLEEDLDRRKHELDEEQQREFNVQRELLESKLELDQLTQEQLTLISLPDAVTEVECVPTPLAKVVEGDSIHLRLSKGLVSVVPLEELLDEIQYNIEGLKRRLHENGRIVETFGPLDGYRLKFTVARKKSSEPVGGPLVGQVRRNSYSQYAEIMPVSEGIGQNVEQSLLPGGRLRRLLNEQRGQKPAFVVWLYTDSFDEFRPLKRALWENGFSLATRPMRPGTHIGASPQGTKAAAQ